MVKLVRCIKAGGGYVEGEIYPIVGNNTGVHILRETEDGDCYDGLFATGLGVTGAYGNFDGLGSPSFEDYKIETVSRGSFTEEDFKSYDFLFDLSWFYNKGWMSAHEDDKDFKSAVKEFIADTFSVGMQTAKIIDENFELQ